LLVYRNPVDTALSLHRQHMRFMERKDDPFVARYMGWLGHQEFGPGHLSFEFAGGATLEGLSPMTVDYWLAYWISVYRDVLARRAGTVRLVGYDQLLKAPRDLISNLFNVLDLRRSADQIAGLVRTDLTQPSKQSEVVSDFGEQANKVFDALVKDSRNLPIPDYEGA